MTDYSPYYRGRCDCSQDDMENAQFSSLGGLGKRLNPETPYYIKESDQEKYTQGYQSQAKALYGDDWRTCAFSWGLALTITP